VYAVEVQRTISEASNIHHSIEGIFRELERTGNTICRLSWVRTNYFLISTIMSRFSRLVYK
jgi:hypothetical protein